MSNFEIGQTVFVATFETREKWIDCPCCFRTRTLKVTLGDGTEHYIPCAGCAGGYEPPKGIVKFYEPSAKVETTTIDGMEVTSGRETEYKTNLSGCSYRIYKASDLFLSESDAKARAEVLADEWRKDQEEMIGRKVKDHRTWAWHVHYHRNCIKKAQQDLEYHTLKLNAAKAHVKQEKVA